MVGPFAKRCAGLTSRMAWRVVRRVVNGLPVLELLGLAAIIVLFSL